MGREGRQNPRERDGDFVKRSPGEKGTCVNLGTGP